MFHCTGNIPCHTITLCTIILLYSPGYIVIIKSILNLECTVHPGICLNEEQNNSIETFLTVSCI